MEVFFVDEIRIATIFNATKSRNQLGLTLGATVTDIGLPYLTLGAEYTRINPFVYRNLTPAQDYTSQDYSLGDWMGMKVRLCWAMNFRKKNSLLPPNGVTPVL